MLALDLGAKRIGVAVADSAGSLATPVTVLQRTTDRRRDHQAICALIEEYDAGRLVVGLPLSLDGSCGPAAEGVLSECEELARLAGVPVEPHDERLSTVTAERMLEERSMDGRARRKVVDMVAASIILQDWLDRRSARADRDADS